jgi:biofilm PGA synthesis protein PgaA
MSREGEEVPPYALVSVAGAYLSKRRPETARDLYARIVADDPKNAAARFGLFYALVETEQFDEALRVIDALAAELPPWTLRRGSRVPIPNEDKLSADIAAANARYYADNLAEAERRLSELAEAAPANVPVRTALGTVYAARGWPRRAREELEIANAEKPHDPGIEVALANVGFALHDWRSAAAAATDLGRRFPEDGSVQRLRRQLEIHDRPELDLAVDRAFRSATSIAGGSGLAFDATLYSAPIDFDWRAYVGERTAHERLREGNITEHVYTGGLEYRAGDLTALAEARLASYGIQQGGGRIAASWSFNDHWEAGGAAEIFAADTPLRALRNGITADAVSGHVTWRQDETRYLALNSEILRFSDDNLRVGVSLHGEERLYTAPHLRLDAVGDLGTSHNTQSNEPFFNPRQDLLAAPGLSGTQILYRRYDFTWEHHLVGTAGPYWEKNFGTGFVWGTRYEHRIRSGDVIEAALGLGFSRQPYDGAYEDDIAITFRLTWRL